jgi:hypothetical protein
MKFQDICRKAEKTAHKVYGLQVGEELTPKGKRRPAIYFHKPAKVDPVAELKEQQKAERKERAERMAELVHAGGIDKCEELGVDISQLLDPPKHITLADGDLPITLALILNKG